MTDNDGARPVSYSIGDVHGEAARLARLHTLIFERHAERYGDRPLRLIHLGDYVDRGPDSASVIEMLRGFVPRPGMSLITLAGNHEAMMLHALTSASDQYRRSWLSNGGDRTLESYRRRGETGVPQSHLDWIAALPSIYVDEPLRHIFVHAGLLPEEYPDESEEVRLWTRARSFFDVPSWKDTALDGWTVIHGHTPTHNGYPEDEVGAGRRINIDTGAVFGGRLTCAILAPGEDVRYLYA